MEFCYESFDLSGECEKRKKNMEGIVDVFHFHPTPQDLKYLSTDYFGTRQIKFGNNMNTIEMHFL